MKFPKYLLASNHYQMPGELVICTEPPFYAAKIMSFKQDWKADEFMSNSDHLVKVRVPGYNIFLYFAGSIKGPRVDLTPDYEARLSKVLREMALFYLTEKMATNPNKVKQYKIYK
jgi:hypothetical protein